MVSTALTLFKGTSTVARVLWKKYSPQKLLEQDFAKAWEEILAETAEAFQRFVAHQEKKNRKLDDKIEEVRAAALTSQLFLEAAHSSSRERIRLMCDAMAGLYDPDISLELKGRTTRAITILEPSDILLLREFPAERMLDAELEVTGDPISVDALLRSGCISDRRLSGLGGVEHLSYGISSLGQAVLEHLEHWQPEEGISEEAPGEVIDEG